MSTPAKATVQPTPAKATAQPTPAKPQCVGCCPIKKSMPYVVIMLIAIIAAIVIVKMAPCGADAPCKCKYAAGSVPPVLGAIACLLWLKKEKKEKTA